jgi:hypothetical protein
LIASRRTVFPLMCAPFSGVVLRADRGDRGQARERRCRGCFGAVTFFSGLSLSRV